jgi:hypothetical protein
MQLILAHCNLLTIPQHQAMKNLYFLIFSIYIGIAAQAQNRFGNTNGVLPEAIENSSFLQFDENPTKLFWAVNLKVFTADQKTTFQDMVFKNDLLVACSTPDANGIWYLSSFKTNDLNTVRVELVKLIDKAKTISLNSQDKYQ